MPSAPAQIPDIAPMSRFAIVAISMLAGIGGVLNLLTGRLGRVVDRALARKPRR